MKRIDQSFVEGINERLPKDRDTGKRLLKLQNARLFGRGDTAFITRMKGFIRLWNDQWSLYEKPLGNIVVEGQVDASDYLRGYRIRLTDSLELEDESNMIPAALLVGSIGLKDELVVKKIIKKPTPVDKLSVEDSIRYKTIGIVRFKDTLELEDIYNIPVIRYVYLQDQVTGLTDSLAFMPLSFEKLIFNDSLNVEDLNKITPRPAIKLFDGVQVVDRDLECLDE
jgi:hypothetical protein